MNSFFEQGNFEAMKKLSGWLAASCDEQQFHAKLRVIAGAVLELLLFESMKSGLNKEI